jgi:hypothetical protein
MDIITKIETQAFSITDTETNKVLLFKKRMLLWDSPVEFVNNMYGAHPDEDGGDENDKDSIDYFTKVFSSKE